MSASNIYAQKIVPAQVGFVAIYNPSLGTTDETLGDQIVYYSSLETRTKQRRRQRTSTGDPPQSSQEQRNERLRNIGLAQGMVDFGRDFSRGRPVDIIETEKSRIVLHELESGWWLIASIELTRLPFKDKSGEQSTEYSSREVKPPALLLEDLLRAHSTFLLHHASSMSALFVRSRRSKFCNLLGRYWDSFLSTWNVMLHGNPVVNVYGGIKLAASGELGVGVGEEDRGSGEREVLEGFVGRIEGLVDVVVSKFGDQEPDSDEEKREKEGQPLSQKPPRQPWLGTGLEPTPEDGAIFLGVQALSRNSLRDITHWMEDVYTWGSRAYGVEDNPTSTRKGRKRARNFVPVSDGLSNSLINDGADVHTAIQTHSEVDHASTEGRGRTFAESQTTVPPPKDMPRPTRTKRSKERHLSMQQGRSSQSVASTQNLVESGGKFANYLKLGYGTHWTLGSSTKSATDYVDKVSEQDGHVPEQLMTVIPQTDELVHRGLVTHDCGSESSITPNEDSIGHYMIGLMGDINGSEALSSDLEDAAAEEEEKETNYRLLLRTVTVELEREGDARAEVDISIDLGTTDGERSQSFKHGGSERTGTSHTSFESQDRNKTKKLRIVVYVNRPFIFTFLFELRTDALELLSLYRSLHHQLGPLQRPLLASTRRRLLKPDIGITAAKEAKAPIYDFIWDSKLLTISSTIPNIPEPQGSPHSSGESPSWSRIEALNTHMQLLNTFISTRSNRLAIENTCKTSRGWWIVWNRIPDPDTASASASSDTPSPVSSSRTLQPKSGESAKSVKSGRFAGTSVTTGHTDQSLNSGSAHPFLDNNAGTRELAVPKDKEVFLLRRASDYVEGKRSGRFGGTVSTASEGGWGSGPAKLAQGIGVDTKSYIEGLLSINR